MINSWKLYKIYRLLKFIFLIITLIISILFISIINNKLIIKSKRSIIKYSKYISGFSLPSLEYKLETKDCYLNREKSVILRNENFEIVKTKNIYQETEEKDITFALAIQYHKHSYFKDFYIEITLSQCNILQLFYNLKIYAGRLTNDKTIVEFMYNALRITTLGSVFLNGSDDNYQINTGLAWFVTHEVNDKSLSKADLLNQGINALDTYKQPFLTNSFGFKNDNTLFSHYAILQGLRYESTLNDIDKNKIPIFKLFNLFQSNVFYQELLSKSNDAEKKLKLKYYYLLKNVKGDYYTINPL